MGKQPSFCNIDVSSTIKATLEGDFVGWTCEQMLLAFVEACSEGVKVSFSYKEAKHSYCVALTLPDFGTDGEFVCATFWDGELYDALWEAYLVYEYFEAGKDGFYNAKRRISEYEKKIAAQIRRFNQEGDTPVRTRPAP